VHDLSSPVRLSLTAYLPPLRDPRRLDSNNSSRGDKTCSDCTAQLEREKRRTDGEYDNPNLPPTSAKIRKIIALLKETHNDTDEKTIIFSQFTSFLDLLEEFLAEEGIKSVRRACFCGPRVGTALTMGSQSTAR
jgi:SNF2 family DNA or RNA helicase